VQVVITVQVGRFVRHWYPVLLPALCAVIFDARRLSVDEVCLCVAYTACAGAYALCFTRIRDGIPFDYMLRILATAFCGERFEVSVKEDTEALTRSGF
jgi:hypothetical protein